MCVLSKNMYYLFFFSYLPLSKVLHTFGGKESYVKVIWAPLWDIEVIVDPKKNTQVLVEVNEGGKKKKSTFTFGTAKGRDEWAEGVMAAKSRYFFIFFLFLFNFLSYPSS